MVPTAVELLTRPRLADGANSVVYTIEPVNSPPTENPCSSRSVTSRMGAATPIDAYVGSRPMSNVAPPMSAIDNTSSARRPMRSPTAPSTRLPIGLPRNPTPNTANVSSSCVPGVDCGKNCAADDAGEIAVDREVEPLHDIADEAGEHGAASDCDHGRRAPDVPSRGQSTASSYLRSRSDADTVVPAPQKTNDRASGIHDRTSAEVSWMHCPMFCAQYACPAHFSSTCTRARPGWRKRRWARAWWARCFRHGLRPPHLLPRHHGRQLLVHARGRGAHQARGRRHRRAATRRHTCARHRDRHAQSA